MLVVTDESDNKANLQKRFLELNKQLVEKNKNNTKKSETGTNRRVKETSHISVENKKKLDEYREKDRQNKKKIKRLQDTKTELEHDLEEKNNYIKKLEASLIIKDTKIEEQEKEIHRLDNENIEIKNSYSRKAFKILSNDNLQLKKVIDKNIYKNSILRKKLKEFNTAIKSRNEEILYLKYGDKEITSRNDIKNLKIELEESKKLNIRLNDRINAMEKEFKKKNEKIITENMQLRNLAAEKLVKKRNKTQEEVIGTLKTINNMVFLCENETQIPANIDKIMFEEGVPCKAIVINNIAFIQETYITTKKYLYERTKLKKKKNKEKSISELKDVNYGFKYNVLVIGSENKNKYLDVLREIGVKADWYDSYERNVVQLKEIVNKYDVIICCLRHSRHYSTEFIKYMLKNYPDECYKYNLLNNDNQKNLVARVRYSIENIKN